MQFKKKNLNYTTAKFFFEYNIFVIQGHIYHARYKKILTDYIIKCQHSEICIPRVQVLHIMFTLFIWSMKVPCDKGYAMQTNMWKKLPIPIWKLRNVKTHKFFRSFMSILLWILWPFLFAQVNQEKKDVKPPSISIFISLISTIMLGLNSSLWRLSTIKSVRICKEGYV